MPTRKYIGTTELCDLTGISDVEARELAQSGKIRVHKTRRGWWRFDAEDVEAYFNVSMQKKKAPVPKVASQSVVKTVTLAGTQTRCVSNDEHYDLVIGAIKAAKKSIVIMTANLKKFRLKPDNDESRSYFDGKPFLQYLEGKAKKGVEVKVVYLSMSGGMQEEFDVKAYGSTIGNFQIKQCVRNHVKMVMVDDRLVYIGSANVTPAGIAQGVFTPGNFELGILSEDPAIVKSAQEAFESVWNGSCCQDCHRRQSCEHPIK